VREGHLDARRPLQPSASALRSAIRSDADADADADADSHDRDEQ
jgi:hypothetical protein